MPTEVKEKPKKVAKWNMNQDDYIELLKSIDTNAKTISSLANDMKKVKTRMGI